VIDAHCHLEDPAFEGKIGEAVARAKEAGVTGMISCAGSIEESRKATETAKKYDEVWAAVGIHPETEMPPRRSAFAHLRGVLLELAKHPKAVAIGEAGLDFFEDTSDKKKKRQTEVFNFNIELAKESGLPLVVHCRKAFEEVYEILNEYDEAPKAVQMHCFTGSSDWTEKFLKLGCYLSFGGIITFKNAEDIRRSLRMTPDDRLLLETDSPYLAPEPLRGSRNEPKNVKIVIEAAADLRGQSIEEIDRITTLNTQRLFPKIWK